VLRETCIGLDYTVALKYHLYFLTWRDIIDWALKNGFHTYHSGPLNYDPKYHLRMALEPLDLYVRAPYGWLNLVFNPILPLLEPTRYDRVIRMLRRLSTRWDCRWQRCILFRSAMRFIGYWHGMKQGRNWSVAYSMVPCLST
jgi:hypothetical protein